MNKNPIENSSKDANIFEVEKLVGKRVIKGVTHYRVKWLGWLEKDNTWQSVEDLQCPQMICHFEDELKEKREKQKAARKYRSKRGGLEERENFEKKTKILKRFDGDGKYTGFARGLKVDSILSYKVINRKVYLLVKWQNYDLFEMVSLDDAKLFCPLLICQFFQDNLICGVERKENKERRFLAEPAKLDSPVSSIDEISSLSDCSTNSILKKKARK